jgi:hypothetical protein
MIEDFFIGGVRQFGFPQVVPVDLAHLVSDNLSIVGPGPGQPLNSDVQKGQFVDQYSDPSMVMPEQSGQGIWYGINTRNIQFEENLAPYPVSDFNVMDISMLTAGSISTANIDLQEGQQFALSTDIQITHSVGPSPCATPFANSLTSSIQQTFTGNDNSNTEIRGVLAA